MYKYTYEYVRIIIIYLYDPIWSICIFVMTSWCTSFAQMLHVYVGKILKGILYPHYSVPNALPKTILIWDIPAILLYVYICTWCYVLCGIVTASSVIFPAIHLHFKRMFNCYMFDWQESILSIQDGAAQLVISSAMSVNCKGCVLFFFKYYDYVSKIT